MTALPKEPQRLYQVGNTVVTDWRLMMLSEDEEELGDTDYFTGIAQLKKHTVAESENHILIKELSVKKLFKILKHCHRKTKEG